MQKNTHRGLFLPAVVRVLLAVLVVFLAACTASQEINQDQAQSQQQEEKPTPAPAPVEEQARAEQSVTVTQQAAQAQSSSSEANSDSQSSAETSREYVPAAAADKVKEYYLAAGRGDYDATYRMLNKQARGKWTLADWRRANRNLATESATYHIVSIEPAPRGQPGNYPMVHARIAITLSDGSVVDRDAYFGYFTQEREWQKLITTDERQLFDDALK